jgi:hypothetical protein
MLKEKNVDKLEHHAFLWLTLITGHFLCKKKKVEVNAHKQHHRIVFDLCQFNVEVTMISG